MENHHIPRLIFFSCFLLTRISAADYNCQPASCGPAEPPIRFPFYIIGQQPFWCGVPGFELTCNKQNKTTIQLTTSRSFIVNRINYFTQEMYIDLDFCQPNRINSFNLTNTPFEPSTLQRYTFYNCSSQNFGFMYPALPLPCLNSANHSVIAVRTGFFRPGNMLSSCEVMKTITMPASRWSGDVRFELELMWLSPDCRSCESEGKACLVENGQTGCLDSSSNGFPATAKYGLSLGIGLPVSICFIGLICYAASKSRDNGTETSHTNQSIDLFSISIVPQPAFRMGLDVPTIESYPKTELGESCRLPNDDSTCAICLSEYKPKESLRTIPECNHYFHADCIDEWLKLNATCPVCRNSPESSSLVTPCSSASTTSADSS